MFFSPENLTKYRLGQTKAENMEETIDNLQTPQPLLTDQIQKIIDMMESKYTADLFDRHSSLIKKLSDEMQMKNYSFYYKDLSTLAKLISLLHSKIKGEKYELIESLVSLIRICNKPFLKEKTSDELNYVPKTINLLNAISLVFEENNSVNDQLYNLFVESITFLNDFACFGVDEYKNQEADFQMKKLYGINFSLLSTLQNEGTRNLRLISNSIVLESLVHIITNNYYEESCNIIVINTLLNCALYKNNAEKLANLGVLKDLVEIISKTVDFRSLIVRACIEAIWNILENGGRSACRMMAFEEIVNSLFYTFNNIIKNCFRLEDRNIRNDICILINYVVSSPASHPHFIYQDESSSDTSKKSFLDTLLKFATYDETISIQKEIEVQTKVNEEIADKSKKTFLNPKDFFLTTSPEDIEFKKIIWTCILYIIKDNHYKTEVITILQQYRFLSCLLLYLDPEAMRFSCISRWQQPQLKDIQLLCLSILLNIIPLYQSYFEEIKGYSTLIKFMQIYSDKERRLICLKTINNIINSELIKKELTEEKLIDFLLEIINSSDNTLEAKEYSFNIISQMCINNKLAQKEFRRKGGIDILKKNMNYLVVLDKIGNQKIFILVVLDCLWNAIIGNKRNEEQFIEMDGLFTLLNLLENSDDIHIKIILSCIASLVDNKRCFSYFIQWKSDSNIDATKLLVNIYKAEDKKYGVFYDNGILINKDRPLNPQVSYSIRKEMKLKNEEYEKKRMKSTRRSQSESFYKSQDMMAGNNSDKEGDTEKSSNFSKNTNFLKTKDLNIYRSEDFIESYLNHKITEITKSFDLRETIFSIFYRIGFNNISTNLPEDKQTFVMIKNYPVFKNLENWKDVVQELEDVKIKPTNDDNNWIMTQIEECEERCIQAIRSQEIIYENIQRTQQDELKDYFSKIKTMFALRKKNQKLKMNELENN